MAIFKTFYTKRKSETLAHLKYLVQRPGKDTGKDKEQRERRLFGFKGYTEKQIAEQIILDAAKGTVFFKMILNFDRELEDTFRDLDLQAITRKTVAKLEERLGKQVQFFATIHDDHTPLRHVQGVIAVRLGKRKLSVEDLRALRDAATEAALRQRRSIDRVREYALQHAPKRRMAALREEMRHQGGGSPHLTSFVPACPHCPGRQALLREENGSLVCPACGFRREEIRREQRLGMSL